MTKSKQAKRRELVTIRTTRHDMLAGDGKDHAKALQKARTAAGLTYAQAAEVIGVSVSTVHSWLKPPTSKSHHKCPKWAVDYLKLETGQE
jgi:DNA-binding transcriptional regulator YiaG